MANMNRVGKTSTTVRTDSGVTRVKYHDTTVVSFEKHPLTGQWIVKLSTGGRRSEVARRRMNQAANQFDLGFEVQLLNWRFLGDWAVRLKNGGVLKYNDDMLFIPETGELV